mgnify:FL=1
MSVSREPQTIAEWKEAYFTALKSVDDHGNCSRCGGIHYGTGRRCVYENEPTTLNKWLVEMTEERDKLLTALREASSRIEIDEDAYPVHPLVAALLQAVSEERDALQRRAEERG